MYKSYIILANIQHYEYWTHADTNSFNFRHMTHKLVDLTPGARILKSASSGRKKKVRGGKD